METKVVNIKSGASYDVYIGRPKIDTLYHYGNPFSHFYGNKAQVVVGSRNEAVEAYRAWLAGEKHQTVEPARRQWILEHLSELKGKDLGCFCYPAKCHGDILKDLANCL